MINIKARIGDTLEIGGIATIRIEEKKGQFVALVIQADRSVAVRRLDVETMTIVEERHSTAPGMLKYDLPENYTLGLFRAPPAPFQAELKPAAE